MDERSEPIALAKTDEGFEQSLRPTVFDDFIGQESVRERLEVLIGAAKARNEPLGHCLFYGPPGLGKTTLANLLAKAMGTDITITSGPVLEKAGDLAGLLTNLKQGDLLFIDEIHRLSNVVEEYLYPAMENYNLDLLIDSGPSARSVQINLSRFTLIGATTRVGLLSQPLRSRFAFTCRLDYYPAADLEKIILRSAQILQTPIDLDGVKVIAARSRGTPRIANNLLRWVRDFAQTRGQKTIDRNCATLALEMLSIDHQGLDEMDKKILTVLIDHHQGGPVGLNSLAVAVGEEPTTLSEVYEPYLIMQGFLKRSPRGREATPLAYQHLGRNRSSNPQQDSFL
jgi:holliday junction DNA helicase RuvB